MFLEVIPAEKEKILDGKYELLRVIGEGGMSRVYLAMDLRLGKLWAVKRLKRMADPLRSKDNPNIFDEGNILKMLEHPSLPRIVDIFEENDHVYIVMDYIRGPTAEQVKMRSGELPETVLLKWAEEICRALKYLHSQKPPIIYRDLKPSNIIITEEGSIKLIDFGIAVKNNDNAPLRFGTRGFSPPEQYRGSIDIRSDIYSFGMTFKYLLKGNKHISEGLKAVIGKCIELEPSHRYQSCSELLTDLKHLINNAENRKRIKRKHIFVFAGVMVIAAALIAVPLTGAVRDRKYRAGINISGAASFTERIEGCRESIEQLPMRADAYMKMLEIFEEKGVFLKEDSDLFIGLYNRGKECFKEGDPSVAALNIKAGEMYLSLYEDEDILTRIQKAYCFFYANHENTEKLGTYKGRELSENYYRICSFYREYVFASVEMHEASKDEYISFFQELEEIFLEAKTDGESGEHEKLLIYNTVFMLSFDRGYQMIASGVDKEKLTGLLCEILEEAEKLRVTREASVRLKAEITENYEEYRYAIEHINTD